MSAIEIENAVEVEKESFLVFSMDNEYYAIKIDNVLDIVRIQEITFVPGQADSLKGIINLRGKIIPIMDLRLKLKNQEKDYNDRTCIIVFEFTSMDVGLIVDKVFEVMNIKKDDISISKTNISSDQKYVKGFFQINKNVVMILDEEKLLFE